MATQELVPVRSLSKSREVFERLRNAIWSGDLAPGTPLREAHLAKQLNVSQVPVREALLQLEHLGLVLRVPDRGTTVTKLTRSEIVQMMEVRRHLELMAFDLAAPRLTKEIEAELRSHVRRMEELAAKNDHFGVAEEDFNFHRTVWKTSGNEVLARTLERLCIAVYAFVSLKRHAAGETMKSAARKHKRLLDALLSRKKERIAAEVLEHLTPEVVIPSSIAGE
ncbi:GntR family transcriptional regulator [Edaphobacter sp.]|uniref:GntR family transcriptional regulator n=1 Tax=Edaphobacter sp. TaxID=1934404 RepID=UPI002BEAD6EA|nr:GntR family transcriptional regulator [Edaphobacter sp.]HEU5340025.1 GntR family transcriptional regulator [Edaphobacter sp.]HWU31662.1 GntR family transcriptional regulator [Marmoricola sp.]